MLQKYLPFLAFLTSLLLYEQAIVLSEVFTTMSRIDRNPLFDVVERHIFISHFGTSLLVYIILPCCIVWSAIVLIRSFGLIKAGIFSFLVSWFFGYTYIFIEHLLFVLSLFFGGHI